MNSVPIFRVFCQFYHSVYIFIQNIDIDVKKQKEISFFVQGGVEL